MTWTRRLLLPVLAALVGPPTAAQTLSPDAQRLQLAWTTARSMSSGTPFDRPITLQSSETQDSLQGDVHALIAQPYALVRDTLARGEHWCGILILHLNVHYCRAGGTPERPVLDAGMGRKVGESLDDLYWVSFRHQVLRSGDDHIAVALQAPTGPLDTRDYEVLVEAAPSADGQTLLHLRYGYSHGLTARLAMSTYLATIGAGKVGFSSVGQRGNGQPIRIGGLRGCARPCTAACCKAGSGWNDARVWPVG